MHTFTETLTPYLIVLAIILLFVSTSLRLRRKSKIYKPQYQHPDGEAVDKGMRKKWTNQIINFLMEDKNKTSIFTGFELTLTLEDTEEIKSLKPEEKEEWTRFLRNKSGWQKGLPYYIKQAPLINTERIVRISESEWNKEQRDKKEPEDGYFYTYYTNKIPR